MKQAVRYVLTTENVSLQLGIIPHSVEETETFFALRPILVRRAPDRLTKRGSWTFLGPGEL